MGSENDRQSSEQKVLIKSKTCTRDGAIAKMHTVYSVHAILKVNKPNATVSLCSIAMINMYILYVISHGIYIVNTKKLL